MSAVSEAMVTVVTEGGVAEVEGGVVVEATTEEEEEEGKININFFNNCSSRVDEELQCFPISSILIHPTDIEGGYANYRGYPHFLGITMVVEAAEEGAEATTNKRGVATEEVGVAKTVHNIVELKTSEK